MKAVPFTYRRAESVENAIELVAGSDGFAKFLGGGQTLGPMINLRLVQPDLLVDIARLPELRGVKEEDDRTVIGAATPHAAFEDGAVADIANGLLRRAASGIAYRAIRNRGTLGGSLAHADPSAEWPVVMTALGAGVRLRGRAGRREVGLPAFVSGPMTTSLADDELIEAVAIPRLSRSARWGFRKLSRKVGEFAQSLAVAVSDRDRRMHRVVLGAAGGAPLVLEQVSLLLGEARGWRDGGEREFRAAYEADIESSGSVLDDYDRHVHGLTVIRAAKEALSQ
jgi:carbon-monoxide dehydrogenase medium subunit